MRWGILALIVVVLICGESFAEEKMVYVSPEGRVTTYGDGGNPVTKAEYVANVQRIVNNRQEYVRETVGEGNVVQAKHGVEYNMPDGSKRLFTGMSGEFVTASEYEAEAVSNSESFNQRIDNTRDVEMSEAAWKKASAERQQNLSEHQKARIAKRKKTEAHLKKMGLTWD